MIAKVEECENAKIIFEILKQHKKNVGIHQIFDENEIFNINTKEHLENAKNSNLEYLLV